jgi:hypothetical protein
MDSRAMGLETEYAQCMERRDRGLRVIDAAHLFDRMERLLLAEHRSLTANSFGRVPRGGPDVEIKEGRFLEVGARFYYDTGHLEWASPETMSAQTAALYDVAAERTLADLASRLKPPGDGSRLMIVKNNVDYVRDRTYGCHENYQVSRVGRERNERVFLDKLIKGLTPFLVTRQIYAGAGRIGGRLPDRASIGFQIAQRTDFIEQISSSDTRGERALINLRDECLGDATRFRRLHLILGDSNRSPEATILKLGATGLVLRLIEAGRLEKPPEMADPIASLREVSSDLTCSRPLALKDRSPMNAIAVQRWYQEQCELLTGLDTDEKGVLSRWRSVLDDLESDPMSAADRIDWTAKLRFLMNPLLARRNTAWISVGAWAEILSKLRSEEIDADRPPPERLQRECARAIAVNRLDWSDYGPQLRLYYELRERDLRYHDLDEEKGLFAVLRRQGRMRDPFDGAAIAEARMTPPDGRAKVRARVIEWAIAHGRAHETTLDWSKASIPGLAESVLFPDPCARASECLEKKLLEAEGSSGLHIRVLSTTAATAAPTAAQTGGQTDSRAPAGSLLREALDAGKSLLRRLGVSDHN